MINAFSNGLSIFTAILNDLAATKSLAFTAASTFLTAVLIADLNDAFGLFYYLFSFFCLLFDICHYFTSEF